MEKRLIDTPVLQVTDPDLLELISELAEVTNVQPESPQSLHSFLVQCLYPAGSGHRYKIEKLRLNPTRTLMKKLEKLQGTQVYQVCDELARIENQTAEVGLNMHLYNFLNKYLPDFEKRRKAPRYDPRDWRG
jgi:hypothetical protein